MPDGEDVPSVGDGRAKGGVLIPQRAASERELNVKHGAHLRRGRDWPGSRLALNSVSIICGKQKGGQLTVCRLAADLNINGFGDDPKDFTALEGV